MSVPGSHGSVAPVAPDTYPQAPSIALPHYTLLEKLGAGGMGEVFLARRDETAECVAIKLLAPPQGPAAAQQRLRFERETQLMERLSHPNIVRVLEHGVAAGQPYLVMEHIAGGSLRGLMAPGRPVVLAKVRQIVRDVAQALAALEEAQIVHRDLKPENVLLDTEGRARVTDFGISAAVTEVGQLTNTTQVLGTLDYMAPEQRARLPADTRADQFSLAVIVYELLTGKRPLGNFKPASQLNKQVHPAVDQALRRALSEDPDDRYATVREFAAALEGALQRRPRRRLRAMLVAASAVLALAGTGLGIVYSASTGSVDRSVVSATGGEPVIDSDNASPPEGGTTNSGSRQTQIATLVQLADDHVTHGRAEEAEAAYTEAIRVSPQDPQLLIKRAALYKRARKHRQGLDDLDAALRLDPLLAEARLRRGEIYVQMGDYQLALAELNEAVRLDERLALAYAYRGWSHRRLGYDNLALADLNQALDLDPNAGMALHYRGLILQAQKRYAEALDDFRRSVDCTPENPFAHSALASLLATCEDINLRNASLAVVHARQACELSQWSQWREVRVLARACAEAGDLESAIAWCQKAMELAPAEYRKGLRDQLTDYRTRLLSEAGARDQ